MKRRKGTCYLIPLYARKQIPTTGPSLARPSQPVEEQFIQEVVPQMDNNYCRKSLLKDSTIPFTEVITHCLTIDCKSCLGPYSNEVLGHRFICKCECHEVQNE
jgi:hypothetical protein